MPGWSPEPVFPPEVLAEVTHEVMKAKNTLVHHDAQRVATAALTASVRALPKLSDDALRPLGLRRL